MTEKEKMLAGRLYNCADKELRDRYWFARGLIKRFNHEAVDNPALRAEILNQLLGTPGRRNWVESPFYCDYGDNIHLGDDVVIGYGCVFQDDNAVTIGDATLIGPMCTFSNAFHPTDYAQRLIPDPATGGTLFTTRTRPIAIGKGCWLGAHCTILPGVTIGDGCVVGAGSVVNRDLPPFTLCVGVPAKPIRDLEKR